MTYPDSDPIVYVRRQWNDWRTGEVALSRIEGMHWDQFSGGICAPAPRPFIHGYVWCDQVVGEIGHSCSHGPRPHRIKVCLVKKLNARIWPRIIELVDKS